LKLQARRGEPARQARVWLARRETVDTLPVLHLTAPLVTAAALGCSVFFLWRRRSEANSISPLDGFRPKIGFSHLDGMATPALLLTNDSHALVWVEEIEISLAELTTDEQVTDASCNGTLTIRQNVPAHDLLPLSLAACIYKAAGEPQRHYSCLLFSTVRYRIDEEWFEKELDVYRIGMIGLVAARVRRERNFVRPAPSRDKSPDAREIAVVK
jgi:hypothetical protein